MLSGCPGAPGPQPTLSRQGITIGAGPTSRPVCATDSWRSTLRTTQDPQRALRELQSSAECTDDQHALAVLTDFSGDDTTAMQVLRDALARSPRTATTRESLIALAVRTDRCSEAEQAARDFEGAPGSGEDELLRLIVDAWCAPLGRTAAVVRELETHAPSDATIQRARNFIETDTSLSPAVKLALHALLAAAAFTSGSDDIERDIAAAEELYRRFEWRGDIPSYYAALIVATRVELEAARFPMPRVAPPVNLGGVRKYRQEFMETVAWEQRRLCEADLHVERDGPLGRWPDLFAAAWIHRSALLVRLNAAWIAHLDHLRTPAGDMVFDLLTNTLGYRYARAALDGYARVFDAGLSLGVSETHQAEALRGSYSFSQMLREQCDADRTAESLLTRGQVRAHEGPRLSPFEWLPMIDWPDRHGSQCDFCEVVPVAPPRELIPPRTRF